jgi:hypothetical protein
MLEEAHSRAASGVIGREWGIENGKERRKIWRSYVPCTVPWYRYYYVDRHVLGQQRPGINAGT